MATSTRARSSAKRTGPNPRSVLLGVAIAVIAGAFLFAAFFMGDGDADAPTVAEVAGSPTVEGEAFPPLDDPATDPAVGSAAPQATGTGFDGEEVSVGAPGTPQMLVFLAAWCPACQAEVPELVEWLEEDGLPAEVELTAVVTGLDDTRPNWPPQAWLEDEGYDGRVLVDDADGTVAGTFGLSATPFWVFIDADGTVLGRVAGQLPMDQVGMVADQLAATAR